jgi:hypothetical protein
MKPSKRRHVVLAVALVLSLLVLTPSVSVGLDVGDKAPLFTGDSTQGPVRLADFIGKRNVVLALYFVIFTPV